MRLVDADYILRLLPPEEMVSRYIVSNVPTIESQRWIPVTEGLPIPDTTVFVTVVNNEGSHIEIAMFSKPLNGDPDWYLMEDYFSPISLFKEKQVIAWMPQPKPYKERRTND